MSGNLMCTMKIELWNVNKKVKHNNNNNDGANEESRKLKIKIIWRENNDQVIKYEK